MNKDKVVISLFDVTGNMVIPWANAGYECYILDIKHPKSPETGGVTVMGTHKNVHLVHWDLVKPWICPVDRDRIAFISAFPPCDHLAVSGARWFKGKGLRLLAMSIEMFATSAEICEWSQAPYMIENPVSIISSFWRKPDHIFNPCDYTGYEPSDNYVKKTCLWTGGGFVMPPINRVNGLEKPDDRIWKYSPGPDRKYLRSVTPIGFARAVYESNAKQISTSDSTPNTKDRVTCLSHNSTGVGI